MSPFSAGVVLGLSCSLAGCHLAFSSDGSKKSTDANGDAVTDAQRDGSDGIANYAFITSTKYDGKLGGSDGANAKCLAAAMAGNLVGNFVAVLGTTTPRYSALKLSSVTDTTGWIRTDRAFVADNSSDFTEGPRNAIVLSELGARPKETTIWTGLDVTGSPQTSNCNEFTSTMGNGGFGDTSSLVTTLAAGVITCSTQHRLLCISVGSRNAVLPLPRQSNRKRIFLSTLKFNGNQDLSTYDSRCAAEAGAAALSGTFAALLPEMDKSALQRTGNPVNTLYVRVDGTPVGPLDEAPLTFLHQLANGTFLTPGMSSEVWTGGEPQLAALTTQNCVDWSATGATGVIGVPTIATLRAYKSGTLQTCSVAARHFYCVEK